MSFLFVVVVLFFYPLAASAEEVWLVVGASDLSPAGIATKGKRLSIGSAIIINSRDCGDKKDVFAWVPKVDTSAGAAKESLEAAKTYCPDAYIKKCHVRPGSLLAFRETAVDLSIADIPATAINWEDADRVSTIQPLKEKWHVIISRYYNGNIEDPLEGRSERVIVVGEGGARHTLESSCVTPEKFIAGTGTLAFQCTEEQAGDELLHKVVVYLMEGAKVKEVTHCRSPKFTTKGTVICLKESVGPDGVLKLLKVEEPLPVHRDKLPDPE